MATEKQQIELSTAQGFLALYNQHYGSTFRIIGESDAPDIRCEDNDGCRLNLEITTTEDRPRDIQALRGRSDHRSLEKLIEHNERVERGLEAPRLGPFDGAVENLTQRIRGKLDKDYGFHVALVVRDTSGLDWEWDEAAEHIAAELDGSRSPFDGGVWVLSKAKDKLFQILPATMTPPYDEIMEQRR